MVANVFSRFAEDIFTANDIANFYGRYSIEGENVSAVSWALTKQARREGSEYLLKMMIMKLLLVDKLEGVKLSVVVEISALQLIVL
ncbi:hypothetical protein OJE16_19685 [Pantoea tagorei]